jgi:hypothetical protein
MSNQGFQYADYILHNGKARVERLKLHIVEITQEIKTGFLSRSNGDGWAFSKHNLHTMLSELKRELQDLEPSKRPQSAFMGMR